MTSSAGGAEQISDGRRNATQFALHCVFGSFEFSIAREKEAAAADSKTGQIMMSAELSSHVGARQAKGLSRRRAPTETQTRKQWPLILLTINTIRHAQNELATRKDKRAKSAPKRSGLRPTKEEEEADSSWRPRRDLPPTLTL